MAESLRSILTARSISLRKFSSNVLIDQDTCASEDTMSKTKEMLDDMHKRKIDMADEIFVINVGGYIGSSTRSEIEYAKATGKSVRYLED